MMRACLSLNHRLNAAMDTTVMITLKSLEYTGCAIIVFKCFNSIAGAVFFHLSGDNAEYSEHFSVDLCFLLSQLNSGLIVIRTL